MKWPFIHSQEWRSSDWYTHHEYVIHIHKILMKQIKWNDLENDNSMFLSTVYFLFSLPDDKNPDPTLERFKTGLKTHPFREAHA